MTYDPIYNDRYAAIPDKRGSLLPRTEDPNKRWEVTTKPAFEPVTVDEVKVFGRIDGTDEDNMLTGFIKAVRTSVEKELGKALIEQTITMLMDFWPDEVILLPRPPLISVVGIYTTDEDNVDTEYDNSNYYIISNSSIFSGQIILKQSVTPPTNTDRDYGGYKIIYKAGYGTSADDVPDLIKEAIKLGVMGFYETRTPSKNLPPNVLELLDLYKVPRI